MLTFALSSTLYQYFGACLISVSRCGKYLCFHSHTPLAKDADGRKTGRERHVKAIKTGRERHVNDFGLRTPATRPLMSFHESSSDSPSRLEVVHRAIKRNGGSHIDQGIVRFLRPKWHAKVFAERSELEVQRRSQ